MNPYSRPPGRPDSRPDAAPHTGRPRISSDGQCTPLRRANPGQNSARRPTEATNPRSIQGQRPTAPNAARQIPPQNRSTPHPAPQTAARPQNRPLRTPEAEARRRAAIAARKREQQRMRKIRIGAILFLTAVVLILLAVSIRACTRRESLPAVSTGDVDATTPAADTGNPITPPTDVTPPAAPPADRPAPVIPTVKRPARASSAVTLTDEIDSEFGVLIGLTDNVILAEKSADARIYPASMTKVMTLIVAYEHIENLSDTFTVTSTIIDPLYRAGATLAGFAPGEEVSLLDLMYGVVLPSGAEASVSLAQYVAGSEEAFADLMNEKAAEMGLTGTHFTNCSGLHDADHYSTPVEMAMILAYAMQYEECAKILSTYQYTTAPTEKHPEGVKLESTMFSRMYGDEPEGVTVLAGKTGYTNEAHHCLVSYAEDDETGAAYIFVSANAKEKFAPVFDAIRVYSDYTE